MGDYFQSTNINAGQYYLNGQPLTTGGGEPHTMLPVGSIIMWNGTQSNIPSGWHLCNGENNTPNLSGRFVISVGTFPGTSGGPTTFNPHDKEGNFEILLEELPPHQHGIYFDTNSGSNLPGINNQTNSTNPSIKPTTNQLVNGTPVVTSDPPLPHYPPYYALCYIMFTGQ